MTPFFDQQATREYQNNTPQRRYHSNLRDAHCPLEPRHCLLLEGFLFEIMTEIRPNLLMMLWVESARLGTELRGSVVIQTYCGQKERAATGGVNKTERRCEDSREESDEAENPPFRFSRARVLNK